MKLIKKAKIIKLFVIVFLVTKSCLKKKNVSYLNQNSKTRYLQKWENAL